MKFIKYWKFWIYKYIHDVIYVLALNRWAQKRNQNLIIKGIWFSNKEQMDWWVKETQKSLKKRAKIDWKLYKVKL